MELNRISVKLFVNDPSAVKLAAFTPLFHKWIQNHTVEGLLIDVADYDHVPNGPGILLVAHDVDYGMDYTGGRAGLLVTRKHQKDQSLQHRIRDVVRLAAKAAAAIEDDGTTGATFDTRSAVLSFIDRLRAPNTAEAFSRFKADIEAATQGLWGPGAVIEYSGGDPRANLAVTIRGAQPVPLATLAERAEAAVLAAR